MRAIAAIAARLEAQGIGVSGTSIFYGSNSYLPSTGDFVTISETGGFAPIASHNDGLISLQRPSFQIIAHAEGYDAAANLIASAYTATTLTNLVVGGIFFLLMAPDQAPFPLPSDSSERVRMAYNISTVHR